MEKNTEIWSYLSPYLSSYSPLIPPVTSLHQLICFVVAIVILDVSLGAVSVTLMSTVYYGKSSSSCILIKEWFSLLKKVSTAKKS